MKNFKITPPSPDRKEIYEENVKPILVSAVDNNAVDKWMFNIKKSGKVDRKSVVYVSTKHKKIFIIDGIYEDTQEHFSIMDDNQIKDNDAYKKYIEIFKKNGIYNLVNEDVHIKNFRKLQSLTSISKPKYVSMKHRDGSKTIEIQKWTAHLKYWDISNDEYIQNSLVIQCSSKTPKIDDLTQDLSFELWIEKSINSSFIPYQELSKEWQKIKKT